MFACITIVLGPEWVGHLWQSSLGGSFIVISFNKLISSVLDVLIRGRLAVLVTNLIWVRIRSSSIGRKEVLVHRPVLIFFVWSSQEAMFLRFESHNLRGIFTMLEVIDSVNQIWQVLVFIAIVRIRTLILWRLISIRILVIVAWLHCWASCALFTRMVMSLQAKSSRFELSIGLFIGGLILPLDCLWSRIRFS